MAGMIEQAQKQGNGAQKYRSSAVNAVPPPLRDAFERIVLAGMKMLYAKDMQDEVEAELGKSGPIEQRIAVGVMGLMGLILQQAKNPPPEVIIPAGIELVYEAADYATEAGIAEVSEEQKKDAAILFAVLMLKQAGASDDQIKSLAAQQAASGAMEGAG